MFVGVLCGLADLRVISLKLLPYGSSWRCLRVFQAKNMRLDGLISLLICTVVVWASLQCMLATRVCWLNFMSIAVCHEQSWLMLVGSLTRKSDKNWSMSRVVSNWYLNWALILTMPRHFLSQFGHCSKPARHVLASLLQLLSTHEASCARIKDHPIGHLELRFFLLCSTIERNNTTTDKIRRLKDQDAQERWIGLN